METKKCTKCGFTMPRSEFYKNKSTPDGLQIYCKKCWGDYERKRKQKKENVPDAAVQVLSINKDAKLLADFTPRELMRELSRRGYKGELTFVQKIDISNM